MSNDMKLIMENWRQSEALRESKGEEIAGQLLAKLEDDKQLDEAIFSIAALVFSFFVKTAAASAMLSAIAKFGSFLQKKNKW